MSSLSPGRPSLGQEEPFLKTNPVQYQCHGCSEKLNSKDCAVALTASRYICCPRCLAYSLSCRNNGWPSIGGESYRRYIYVQPSTRSGRVQSRVQNLTTTQDVDPPPPPPDPVYDPIRYYLQERAGGNSSDDMEEVMLISFAIIGPNDDDITTFSFSLDASEDGYKYTSDEDIDNLCASAQLLSPFVTGSSVYQTPEYPPTFSEGEGLNFAVDDDARAMGPFLYCLMTAEPRQSIDKEQVKNNPYYRKRYYAAWCAGELLIRQLRETPSYLQCMLQEFFSLEKLSSRASSLASRLSFLPSRTYGNKERAEAAVKHVLDGMELDEDGLYFLFGDNLGGMEEGSYDQFTVLYFQHVPASVCKYTFKLDECDTTEKDWSDIIGEEENQQAREAAANIPLPKDRDVEVVCSFRIGLIDQAFGVARKVVEADPVIGLVDDGGDTIGRKIDDLRTVNILTELPNMYRIDLLGMSDTPLQTEATADIVGPDDNAELLRLAKEGWETDTTTITVPKPFAADDDDESNAREHMDEQDEDEEEEEEEVSGESIGTRGAVGGSIVGRTNILDASNLKLLKAAHQNLAKKEMQQGMANAFIDALQIRPEEDGEERDDSRLLRLQERVGAAVVQDNDPINGLNRLLDADRLALGRYYPYLRPFMAGFHAVNQLHRMHTRNCETVLGHFVRLVRPNDGEYYWMMLPRDPNDREKMLPVYLWARQVARIIQLQRARKRPVSSREVYDHARARAEQYPVCLMLLQDETLLMSFLILKMAEKNGPAGVELFQTGLRLAGIQYAAGNSPNYVRSLCEMLKFFATASGLLLKDFALFLFVKATATGNCFKFCDLINEKIIQLYRQPMGKKKTRGWKAKMEQVSALIPQWLRYRWKDYKDSGTDGVTAEQADENRRLSAKLSDELELFFWLVVTDSIERRLDGEEDPLLGDDYVEANATEVRTLDGDLVRALSIDVIRIGISRLRRYFARYYVNGPLYQVKRRKKEVDLSRLQTTPSHTENELSKAIIRATSVDPLELTKGVITIEQAKEEISTLRELLVTNQNAQRLPAELPKTGVKHEKYVEQLISLRRRYFRNDTTASDERMETIRQEFTTQSTVDERKDILGIPLYVGNPRVLGLERYNTPIGVFPPDFNYELGYVEAEAMDAAAEEY